MKKYIALILTAILFPSLSLAASLYFVPNKADLVVDDKIVADIYLNSDSKIYTAKIVLRFDPNYLQVQGFNFIPNHITLNQSGYDKLDNNTGILIKTAGFPNGLDGNIKIATVQLSAKGDTSLTKAQIAQNESMLLDDTNNNALSSSAELLVSISKKKTQRMPVAVEVNVNKANKSTKSTYTSKPNKQNIEDNTKNNSKTQNNEANTETVGTATTVENLENNTENNVSIKEDEKYTQLAYVNFASKYAYVIFAFIILAALAAMIIFLKKKV